MSKWHLGIGALEGGQPWVIAVLLASTLLNAAYFLPILRAAWFCEPDAPWPAREPGRRFEASRWLLFPAVATALLSLGAGLFAGAAWSPLALAKAIAAAEYLP